MAKSKVAGAVAGKHVVRGPDGKFQRVDPPPANQTPAAQEPPVVVDEERGTGAPPPPASLLRRAMTVSIGDLVRGAPRS